MKENRMWPKLHKRLRIGHRARCTRIENLVATGTPDINCTVDSKMFWIESKWSPAAVRGTSKLLTQHKMTVEQINFHIGEHRAGGVSWVWVQHGKNHYLFPGQLAPMINDLTVQDASPWLISINSMVNKLLSD